MVLLSKILILRWHGVVSARSKWVTSKYSEHAKACSRDESVPDQGLLRIMGA